jgi:hypothetical protein
MKDQIYFRYGAKNPPIDLSVPDLFLSSLAILLYFVLMFSLFGDPDQRLMVLRSLQNLVYFPLQWSLISWIALRHSKFRKFTLLIGRAQRLILERSNGGAILTGNNLITGSKTWSLTFCQPQITHGLIRDRTLAPLVRYWGPTTWATVRPVIHPNYMHNPTHAIL